MNTHKTQNEGQAIAFNLPVMLSNLHIGQVIKSVFPMNSDYTIMDIDYKKGKLLMKQNNIGNTRWIDAQELVANY